jgi:nitrite reductase/ring-hydroxylating ferredoxin subunit
MTMNDRAGPFSGLWLRRDVRDLSAGYGMKDQATCEIVEAVARIKGDASARILQQHGIQRLHEVISADDFSPLRDQALERLRQPLFAMAVAVGREFLGWEGDFYVDDYLVLRINFPYEVARRSSPFTENPGTGRLSPPMRAVYDARKVIDPIFDPKSYHGGNPPAAWAHGPHRDSWTGHSRGGRNIWLAIGDVPAEAGMVLYPETDDDDLRCDPRSLYLAPGCPLPRPTFQPLKAGEMLVFDPEVLHGTHLNSTNSTRVAISLRLNAAKPTFDPSCFYAREFWRLASDIERGRDEVYFLRREDNLGPALIDRQGKPRAALPRIPGSIDSAAGIMQATLDEESASAPRVIVEAAQYRIMVVRVRDGLRAYEAACPHNGADLADGGCDDSKLYCPACALGFDPQTGRSSCPTLSLRTYEAWETSGTVQIRLASS